MAANMFDYSTFVLNKFQVRWHRRRHRAGEQLTDSDKQINKLIRFITGRKINLSRLRSLGNVKTEQLDAVEASINCPH